MAAHLLLHPKGAQKAAPGWATQRASHRAGRAGPMARLMLVIGSSCTAFVRRKREAARRARRGRSAALRRLWEQNRSALRQRLRARVLSPHSMPPLR